jgi:hypothetical protein
MNKQQLASKIWESADHAAMGPISGLMVSSVPADS